MWNRGGTRSSALERAKAQLSGQRVNTRGTTKNDAQRDVSNLGKGLIQAREAHLLDLSDLSSEDAGSDLQDHNAGPTLFTEPPEQLGLGGGSRFLKKSARSATTDGRLSASTMSPNGATDLKLVLQRNSQSVALSKLALIEDRIRNQKNKRSVPDTGPDLSVPQRAIQSSSEGSMAGSRFLKKKAEASADLKEQERKPLGSHKAPQLGGNVIDSDEEDIRRLLGGSLDSPDGSLTRDLQKATKGYRKDNGRTSYSSFQPGEKHEENVPVSPAFRAPGHYSVSPSPPSLSKALSVSRSGSLGAKVNLLSLSSASSQSEFKSLEELFTVASYDDNTLSEKSGASDDFNLNIMTLDDLAPVSLDISKLSKEKTEASPAGITELNPPSANETSHEDRHAPDEASAQYESDFESEIQTETAVSANEMSELFSDGDKNSSIVSDPHSYTHPVDHTHSEESSNSTSTQCSKSQSSFYSHNISSHSNLYSSDDTITQSKAQNLRASRPAKVASVQTQRDGLTYTWSTGPAVLGPSLGMSHVDPTPVASHTVSAEAVEVLSAYSPAVFALNDMLRQQLVLTRSFIDSSRHLHQAMVEALGSANYRYTTLEDTKEFICCNRSPKLTEEDALEEVLREMSEYHYI